jgi:D-xylose transport system substrate-binding protein
MRKRWILVALVVGALTVGVAACGGSDDKTSSGSSSSSGDKAGKVGVLLPDTKSSARWETADRPLIGKALKAAGVPYTITNAEGDAGTQASQADQAITNGAKVLMLVDLDPGSGAAIIRKAHNQGVKVIDYDRLTLGGDADFYVSFDNVEVGKLMGQELTKALEGKTKPVVAQLDGGPEDNNATLFAQGYDSILDPLFKDGTLVKGPKQAVERWDNQRALTIFEQMLQRTNGKIDASIAANDGLANAAISALKARKLPNIPITGQDATVQGIQHILAGEQLMTVYKPIAQETAAATKVAIALAKGETPATNAQADNKGKKTASVLLHPIAVTIDNIKDTVIKDGYVKKSEACVGRFAALCTKAGI